MSSRKYGKNDARIESKVGDVFSIELESNPTTGYEWQADFDPDKVKLKEKTFKSGSEESLGAAGKEILVFETVSEGDSRIRLDYKRSWEEQSAETVEFEMKSQK